MRVFINKPGFTLLEVLFAFGVLLMTYSGLVMYNRSLSTSTTITQDSAQMESLAQEGIDQILLLHESFINSGLGGTFADYLEIPNDNKAHQRYLNYLMYDQSSDPVQVYPQLKNSQSLAAVGWCDHYDGSADHRCPLTYIDSDSCKPTAGSDVRECVLINQSNQFDIRSLPPPANLPIFSGYKWNDVPAGSVNNEYYYRQIDIQLVEIGLRGTLGCASCQSSSYLIKVTVTNSMTRSAVVRQATIYE